MLGTPWVEGSQQRFRSGTLPHRFYSTSISARAGLYSPLRLSARADTYRITLYGPEFMVSQNAGVTVGVCNTEQEAQLTVEDCERDDLVLETARSLVEKAVDAFILMHRMDRQSALDWIREAAD